MSEEVARTIGALASIVAAVGVAAGFFFGIQQLRLALSQLAASKRSQQAQTLLQFDQMLDRHRKVATKLRPGGAWTKPDMEFTPEQWSKIERYLGLFERAKILIDDGFLEVEEFDHLYGYLVRNIRANPVVAEEKLEKRAYGWTYFLELEKLLEEHEKRSASEMSGVE